eukprot:TRINITY_DN1257_c1_g1_i1.p1 TRINITY_DN1257_c1_g1~~TRINITY_DN1257_c1_g1_i1.p1  ORF type:complete len:220 (+),score=35.07 TRINITY_DN1257_c1_g1_i1:81-740(+)
MVAAIIGATCAIVCRFFAIQVKNRFGYDDTLDVFNVHGVAGFVGTLLLGVLCWEGLGGTVKGDEVLSQLGSQALVVVIATVYTLVVTYVILLVTSLVCRGVRVLAKIEQEGLDKSVHGEQGYVLFIADEKKDSKGSNSNNNSEESVPLLAYEAEKVTTTSTPSSTSHPPPFGTSTPAIDDSPYNSYNYNNKQTTILIGDQRKVQRIDSHQILISDELDE